MKNQYRGGGLLKKWEGGLDNLPILGGLARKREVVFLRRVG